MSASDEAKKALEGVTPGPWRHAQEAVDPEWSVVTTSGGVVIANINDRADRHPNACFIAWAREGVPALLADIAAKDAEIARLTAKPSPDVAALVEALRDALLWTADYEDRAGWRGKARAAIARVKGDTHE